MKAIFSDVPFDVVVMDVWKPGKFASKKKGNTAVLTCLDIMTAFAGADFLESELASEAAMKAFQTFFVTRGFNFAPNKDTDRGETSIVPQRY